MISARQGCLALAVCVLASTVGPVVGQVPQGETSDLCSCHGVPKKWVILAGDETKRIQLTAYAALTGAQGTKTVALLPAPKVADLGTYPLGQLTSIEFAVAGVDPDVHECQPSQPDVYANLQAMNKPLRLRVLSPDGTLQVLDLVKVSGMNLWSATWSVPQDKLGEYRFRVSGMVEDLHADHPKSADPPVHADFRAKLTIVPKVEFIRQDNSVFPNAGNGACHMVSKYKTDVNLPDTATFIGPPGTDPDPDTFRVQIVGLSSGKNPQIKLDVVRGAANVYSHTYSVVDGTEGGTFKYRTQQHVRLVSNDVDDGYLLHQTPLVRLGDVVRATLVLAGSDICSIELPVARPSSDIGINAIRRATCHFVVVDYSDVAANADVTKTTQRMTEAWAQAAARFEGATVKETPVKNVISVWRSASASGTFAVKIDAVSIPAFPIAEPGRRSPMQIAEDIAAGINSVIGEGKAHAFNTAPGFNIPEAHVVVKKGSNVTLTKLEETVEPTIISVPTFSINDADIELMDEEPCLVANYGDGNPDTIDLFIVKTLGSGNRGEAWTVGFCGSASDMRNTSFIALTAGDTPADNPQVAAHEAGRFLLNFDGLDSGEYNLMNETSDTDSISARKRLTPTQHQMSRTVSDGTLLKP